MFLICAVGWLSTLACVDSVRVLVALGAMSNPFADLTKKEVESSDAKGIDGEEFDASDLGPSASIVNAAVAATALRSKEAAGALAPTASKLAEAAVSTLGEQRREEVEKGADAEDLTSKVAAEASKELTRYATMPLAEASRVLETKLVDGVREAIVDSENAPDSRIIGATAYLQTAPRPSPMFGDIPSVFEPENAAQLVSTQGRARLQRLRDQPRPFFEKAKLVQASVWAQCLYGLEGHVLPAHDFRSLRTLASIALVGPCASASPYLTLAAVTTRVQDSELYCLEAQLRALRRMWAFDPGAATSIQFWASRPDVPRRAYGPGTALCISLARAGLTLFCDGLLKSPSCHAVNIAECSKSDLRQVLGMAWAHHVADRVAHRNGLHAGHLPCPLLTQRALAKLAPYQVQIVVRHIVGGFLSSAAKNKWDDSNPVGCPLCGCPDTK